MVRIKNPLFSEFARGWLGRGMYARLGVVLHPYPYGIGSFNFNQSAYYSKFGWTYQVRRTWHGMQNVAMRPAMYPDPGSPSQLAHQAFVAQGVAIWQAMPQALKDVYNRRKYPPHMAGYHIFLHYFISKKPC